MALGGQGEIHLWNTETGARLDVSLLDEHNANGNGDLVPIPDEAMLRQMPQISALAFSPDGKKLVSGTIGGKVQMWDAETGVELAPFLAGQDMDKATKRDGENVSVRYRDPITTLALSSDNALLVVGSERKIRLLGSSKQPRLKEAPRGTKSLAFSPDDSVLLAGLETVASNYLNSLQVKK